MNDFETLATTLGQLREQDLQGVANLVRTQLALERTVENLEEQLKKAKEELRQVAEDLLPSALEEYGLRELRMADGSIVSTATFYGASIPKERTAEAFHWLRNNAFGDLIKNTVSVSFGRDEDKAAQKLIGDLSDRGFNTSQKEWVEPMTLKAFVKEQLEAGRDMPTDLFGVFIGKRAKIKGK